MQNSFFRYGEIELHYLRGCDASMQTAIERIGSIERETDPDLFSSLVNSIVGQQVSSAAQATVWGRLCSLGPVTPEVVGGMSREDLRRCGMSYRKADYIRGAAQAVQSGRLDLEALDNLPDDEVVRQLTALPGVGVWTAEMLMLFSMQRPDILSFGDLGIRRGLMRMHGHEDLPRALFEEYRKRYSPYGSVASLYLWAVSAGR